MTLRNISVIILLCIYTTITAMEQQTPDMPIIEQEPIIAGAIPDIFTTIRCTTVPSVQPLPLPITPAQELEYNKQLALVFHAALSKIHTETEIKIDDQSLWQLFGRMLYPRCTQYPEIAEMIDFITMQREEHFEQPVHTTDQNTTSLISSPEPSELVVRKNIESIVLEAYMQQHPELFEHVLENFRSHTNFVTYTTLTPDGKPFASGSTDHIMLLWNLTNKSSRGFKDYIRSLNSIALSPNNKTLASGTANHTIQLRDIAHGSSHELRGHTSLVTCVAFSPNGSTLASGSVDHTIRLWNLTDGSSRELRGHTGLITCVTFSLDGKTLASAADDHTIRLWDIARGPSHELTKHTDFVTCIAFSPDGKTLASGSIDHTIRLWSIADGSSHKLRGHTDLIYSIAFSPDGRTLTSKSDDHTIRRWGYLSLHDALQAPIQQTRTTIHMPEPNESSATPSAPGQPA